MLISPILLFLKCAFAENMGCLKLTYRQEPELRVSYFTKELTPKNTTSKGRRAYLFGFNGQEGDDEIYGEGNSYTTQYRQYDPRLGRWLSLDPAMNEFPWQSPYVGLANNPIFFVDPKGDSTKYYDSKGNLLHKSNDGLENAIVVIANKNLETFKAGLKYAKSKGFEHNDKANRLGRSLGVGYAVNEYFSFYDNNLTVHDGRVAVPIDGKGPLYNEWSAALELVNGFMRIDLTTKDTEGSPSFVRDPVGPDVHTHPNTNRRFTYVRGPKAGLPWQWPDSEGGMDSDLDFADGLAPKKGIFNVVVDDDEIILYQKGKIVIVHKRGKF